MKLSELKSGDRIRLDDGFDCAKGTVTVHVEDGDPFFYCREGRHWLDNQVDSEGNLIGISKETEHG